MLFQLCRLLRPTQCVLVLQTSQYVAPFPPHSLPALRLTRRVFQKGEEDDDPTVYGSDRGFKPGENESRFSGYRFWRWKTRKEDDEFADQVMKEEAGLQREPLTAKRSSDSSGSGGRDMGGRRVGIALWWLRSLRRVNLWMVGGR
ncbi:hypothetical protein BC629DRAFT_363524 [Irpex lacteus]|nr:hypothetical protein BC629DRAFT_363524 [Irpex lacteus]